MKKDNNFALETAVFAGHILLESGAEIFRVEETVKRIASAFGVTTCNTFTMSSGLFVTAGGFREEYFAKVKHIPFSAARLDKVEAVNQLSREISQGKYTVAQAWMQLERIQNMPKKSNRSRILASGIGAGSFSLLFGGSLWDGTAAFVAGVILYCYLLTVEGKKLSKITVTIGGGALSTLSSLLLWKLGLGHTLSQVIIGSIIPLVPGVSFTNAIRDIADGDYIAGSIRMIDALLVAFSIAAGVGLVLTIWRQFFGGGVVF